MNRPFTRPPHASFVDYYLRPYYHGKNFGFVAAWRMWFIERLAGEGIQVICNAQIDVNGPLIDARHKDHTLAVNNTLLNANIATHQDVNIENE